MADDATVPPSPARIRRAWAAGRRASSTWLPVGLALLLGAGVLAQWRPMLDEAIAARRTALVHGGEGAGDLAIAAASSALVVTGVVAAIVLCALVLAALVQGRLGPVTRDDDDTLGARPVRTPVVSGLVLALALLAIVAGDVLAIVVGSARAADASATGLADLWHGATTRLLLALGVAATALGLVEAWWSRRAHLAALALTPAQARDEARRGPSR